MTSKITTLLFLSFVASTLAADSKLVTNVVGILPYVERFARALEVELPQPLTTNDVDQFRHSQYSTTSGLRIHKRWTFGFDGQACFITQFTDLTNSMTSLWRAEDIKPLIKPSKVTKQQAVQVAWRYLNRLGYKENELPILAPQVKDWRWTPVNEKVDEPLPFFSIEWPWKERPELTYLTVEVNGLLERITHLSILATNSGILSYPPGASNSSTHTKSTSGK
jgi:hypothetical protein